MIGKINVLADTIPVSLFNRGLAGRVFTEVKKSGAKVVIKNNVPECVLISPEEYTAMIDELEDAKLLALANERLANTNWEKIITDEEFKKKYGITEDMLKGYEEIEFE